MKKNSWILHLYKDIEHTDLIKIMEFDTIKDCSDVLKVEDFDLPDLNTFTMAIWLKFPDAFTSNYAPCFFIGESTFNHQDHYAYIGTLTNDNKIVFSINKTNGGNRGQILVETNTLDTDVWYRLVGVYNGAEDKIYLYLNGILIGTDTPSDEASWSAGDAVDFATANNDVYFGGGPTNANEIGYHACNAQFWDVAWSADNVISDFNNL